MPRQGFTLVEVLVAFAILSLALAVVHPILSDGAKQSASARNESLALMLAQSGLDEASSHPEQGTMTGIWGDAFHWERTIHPWREDGKAVSGMLLVSSIVRWDEAGRMRRIELRSLRLVPEE